MNPEKYQSYNITDFVEDEIFIEWVLNKDPEVESFWKAFIEKTSQ